jgi:CHAT domain
MGDNIEQEVSYLEEVVAGRQRSQWRQEAAAGRLAELYLQARDRPARFGAAYRLAQTALDNVSTSDPLYPKLLHVVAMALRLGGDPQLDTDAAWARAEAFDRDSWLLSLDPAPQEALGAARQWAQAAWFKDRWSESAEAFHGAEIALNRLILRETQGLPARLERLTAYRDQAPRAAFAFAKAQRPREAMVVLERAAALLSSYGEHGRTMRDLAAAGHAELRDKLLAAMQAQYEIPSEADRLGRRSPAWVAAQTAVDAVVNEIRGLEGWSWFATPTQWEEIVLAARDSAIAYVAPTDKGTVVLVLDEGGKSTSSICLDATLDELSAASRPWLERQFEGFPGDPQVALTDLLRWLGENIMVHVYRALDGDRRVTLIPFGTLALHPLHAALVMLPATDERPEGAHVLFHPSNVSYAYSARTLNSSRRRKGPTGVGEALVVNNPEPLPVEYDKLLLSDFERDAVATHFKVRELAGRAAVTKAVRDAMADVDVIHLICHGTVSKARQYAAMLLLAHREVLTAESFVATEDLTARLVVLSACRSGAAALGPAGVASLPAMLVAAGVSGVLSTFWHTDEMATLLLITRFYELWQGGRGVPAAVALGRAQEWLCFSSAAELRAACPRGALDSLAGAELAQAAPSDRPYNQAWHWAAFFLVGDC